MDDHELRQLRVECVNELKSFVSFFNIGGVDHTHGGDGRGRAGGGGDGGGGAGDGGAATADADAGADAGADGAAGSAVRCCASAPAAAGARRCAAAATRPDLASRDAPLAYGRAPWADASPGEARTDLRRDDRRLGS